MQLSAEVVRVVELMKSSLSLLLNLVSDIVDLKLIKENQFICNKVVFSPTVPLMFIKELFSYQARLSRIKL